LAIVVSLLFPAGVLLGWAFSGWFGFALCVSAVSACSGHVAGLAEGAQVEAGVVSAAFDVVHVGCFLPAEDARVVVSFEDAAPQGRPVRWEFFAAP
jgi:hypothetical protein